MWCNTIRRVRPSFFRTSTTAAAENEAFMAGEAGFYLRHAGLHVALLSELSSSNKRAKTGQNNHTNNWKLAYIGNKGHIFQIQGHNWPLRPLSWPKTQKPNFVRTSEIRMFSQSSKSRCSDEFKKFKAIIDLHAHFQGQKGQKPICDTKSGWFLNLLSTMRGIHISGS